MKIGFLGAGAWGTALANLLATKGLKVILWDKCTEALDQIRTYKENLKYLPGIKLHPGIEVAYDPHQLISESDVVIIAVVSTAFRQCAKWLTQYNKYIISATKGIEYDTGLTMTGILEEVVPGAIHVAISGPSFAIEVAQQIPTAIVSASKYEEAARFAQELFRTNYLRVYTSKDTLGVELGGALKNVIAIAAGISDGLGFGDNSKAALVTRALSEIRRLGTAVGAMGDTFNGLSGLGDLAVTCFSKLSRNRAFGERIGKGESVQSVIQSYPTTVEGYPTARAAYRMARKFNVSTPIIDQVYSILYEGKDPRTALFELMNRDPKPED